jgi:prephenate dehydrogenase
VIGGSIARRAHARGDRVLGFDPHGATIAFARAHEMVDEVVDDVRDLLGKGETFVVAAPLGAALEILDLCAAAPSGKTNLVLDVTSVKVPLVPFIQRVHGFVPSHPLAGAESSGPAASRADLFEGRPWIYVPTGDAKLDALAADFIITMGALPVALDAVRHDRVVALTSHVPQLLSTALAAGLGDEEDPLIAQLYGPGLESMLRLARSGWPIWSPVIAANGQAIAPGLRALAAAITATADRIDAGDASALETLFEAANEMVARLDAGPRRGS